MEINEVIEDLRYDAQCNRDALDIDWAEKNEQLAEWLEELKAYKDAEEQGLLLRLPCKVGDIFYCIAGEQVKRIHEMEVLDINPFGSIYHEDDEEDKIIKIYNMYLDGNIGYLHCRFSDVGKTVFFTKEEAEQALSEMKGE